VVKKILGMVVVAAIAKVVLDKLTKGNREADLWAEATDSVE
jgi:hypothetical protein